MPTHAGLVFHCLTLSLNELRTTFDSHNNGAGEKNSNNVHTKMRSSKGTDNHVADKRPTTKKNTKATTILTSV